MMTQKDNPMGHFGSTANTNAMANNVRSRTNVGYVVNHTTQVTEVGNDSEMTHAKNTMTHVAHVQNIINDDMDVQHSSMITQLGGIRGTMDNILENNKQGK